MTEKPIQPSDRKFEFVEIPDNHPWVWYMKEDSPWFELSSSTENGNVTPYGHVRTWIEENANGKVFIQFGKRLNKEKTEEKDYKIYDDKIIVLFDDPTDYIAFKLMFPELCRI